MSGQGDRKPSILSDAPRLTPNNAVAGVKRKSEEPEATSKPKLVKTEANGVSARPTAQAPTSRFQLSTKSGAQPKPSSLPNRPSPNPTRPSDSQSRPALKSNGSVTPTPPSTATGPPPAKRGYASIMERAKAAQEAAKAAGPSTIKHKAVEKLTRKERLRLIEEQKAQQKAAKSADKANRSRSGTPVGAPGRPGLQQKKSQETSYKGTMKKAPEPLSYKGTMQAAGSATTKERDKRKGQAQDKYGGYANWDELDDADDDDDEEEEGHDSEGSSDMEGGFDDVEMEEMAALRNAQKEDREALQEEEKLKKEKLERKRKLEALSKSAAARKKY